MARALSLIRSTSSGGGASPMRYFMFARPMPNPARMIHSPMRMPTTGSRTGRPRIRCPDADDHSRGDQHVVAVVDRGCQYRGAARPPADGAGIQVHAELDHHDAGDEEDRQQALLDLLPVEEPGYRLRDDLEADDAGENGHQQPGKGLRALVSERVFEASGFR